MSTNVSPMQTVSSAFRWFLTVSGIVALAAGIIVLVWPGHTIVALTIVLAIYLVVVGLVYIFAAFGVGPSSGWARVGHIFLGIVYIIAGIIAFANPETTGIGFALIVVIFIGISWIADGIVAFSLLGTDRSKGWTIFFGIVSIAAGVFVIIAPAISGFIMWIMLGASLVALGLMQIIRSFTLSR